MTETATSPPPADLSVPPPTVRNLGGRPRKYATREEYSKAMLGHKKENRRIKNAERYKALQLDPTPGLPAPPKAQDLQSLVLEVIAPLSVPDAAFVTEVCGGATYAKAYEKVYPGTPTTKAGPAGSRKAAEVAIQGAIASIKARLAERVAYDFSKFMSELDDAMLFAKATGSAPALVRAVELRGKATGQLADKREGSSASSGFMLVIGGLDNAVAERVDG